MIQIEVHGIPNTKTQDFLQHLNLSFSNKGYADRIVVLFLESEVLNLKGNSVPLLRLYIGPKEPIEDITRTLEQSGFNFTVFIIERTVAAEPWKHATNTKESEVKNILDALLSTLHHSKKIVVLPWLQSDYHQMRTNKLLYFADSVLMEDYIWNNIPSKIQINVGGEEQEMEKERLQGYLRQVLNECRTFAV